MITSSNRIESLVTRIQDEFLEAPGLTLALPEAQRRFDADKKTCEAVLGVLVDAKVLARTQEGAYVRHFPRLVARAGRQPRGRFASADMRA